MARRERRESFPLPPPQALLSLLLVMAVLAAVLADTENNQVADPAQEASCRPGEVFRRACNFCVCPASGLSSRATCTTRPCVLPTKRRFRRAPGNGERCAPNIRYMDDCNLCICSADGIKAHSSCTFAQCPHKPR